MRRFLSVLLILCLLFSCAVPALSLAAKKNKNTDPAQNVHPDASLSVFDLDLSMDVSGFPEKDRERLQGFADLVNMLSVKGQLILANDKKGCFDMTAVLSIHNGEKTSDINFRVYGNKTHWLIKSPLLGDSAVLLNIQGLLEFSMKAFSYLSMPMQNASLYLVPYTTLEPVRLFLYNLRMYMKTKRYAGQDRVVDYSRFQKLAAKISRLFESNQNMKFWLKALGGETGYDEILLDDLSDLESYVASFIPESGVQVVHENGTEIWKTIYYRTLFKRTETDSSDSWQLSLPRTLNGEFTTNMAFDRKTEEGLNTIQASLLIDSREMGTAVDLKFDIQDFPSVLPVRKAFSATMDMQGDMRPNEVVTLAGDGDGTGNVSLSLARDGNAFIFAKGTMTSGTPDFPAHIKNLEARKGFNILSVNDNSLRQFLNEVSGPLAKGLLPILTDIPASTYQSFLDFLSRYGVLSLLTYGMTAE